MAETLPEQTPLTGGDFGLLARRADSMMDHGGETDPARELALKTLRDAAWDLAAREWDRTWV